MPRTDPDIPLSTLLQLALIPYRGLWDPGRDGLGDEVLQGAIVDGLAALPDLNRRWRLAWGPSRYDPRFTLFDDHLMFAAQDRTKPFRFVFVVRATNPRSLLDWLLGDPWIGRTVRWQGEMCPGSSARHTDGRVSLSAALGFVILRNMRSHPLPEDPLTRLWRRIEDGAGERVRRTARWMATRIRGKGGRGLRTLQAPLREDVRNLDPSSARRREEAAQAYLEWLASGLAAGRRPIFPRFVDRCSRFGVTGPFDLLSFLEGNAHLRHRVDPGLGSLAFLQEVLEKRGKVEVVVTGHGKGGTLALLFALWLTETRTSDSGSGNGGWDRDGQSRIRCITFAAPPAGDAAFARHAERMLGGDLIQVAGERDIVPNAWTPGGLESILECFPGYPLPPGLESVVRELSPVLDRVGYTPIPSAAVRVPGHLTSQVRSFYQQALYQHLEAYLEDARVGADAPVRLFLDRRHRVERSAENARV